MRLKIEMLLAVVLLMLTPSSLLAQPQGGKRIRLNRAIERLEQGKPVFGVIIADHSVSQGRLLRDAGVDFLALDMEHQVYDFRQVQDFLLGLREQPFPPALLDEARKAQPATFGPPAIPTPLIKVTRLGRENVEFDVRHALKLGALGVFIPYTESKAEIEAAVRAASDPESRYLLGTSPQDFRERNGPWPLLPKGEFLVGAMIESPTGEAHIEEILSTPGLGVVWIAHPSSEEAGKRILKLCLQRGIIGACQEYDPSKLKARLDEGYKMIFLAWDAMLFYRGLNEVLKAAREATENK